MAEVSYLKRKEGLEKIRSNRRVTDKNKKEIDALGKRVTALDKVVVSLQEAIDLLKTQKPEEPDIPGELPVAVNSLASLRSFIANHPDMGEVWAREEVAEKKTRCAVVRDALAETYSDIERINDQKERHNYTRDDDGHRDAVMVVVDPADPDKDKVYDFCVGSSDPGDLWNSLCWNHEKVTPW